MLSLRQWDRSFSPWSREMYRPCDLTSQGSHETHTAAMCQKLNEKWRTFIFSAEGSELAYWAGCSAEFLCWLRVVYKQYRWCPPNYPLGVPILATGKFAQQDPGSRVPRDKYCQFAKVRTTVSRGKCQLRAIRDPALCFWHCAKLRGADKKRWNGLGVKAAEFWSSLYCGAIKSPEWIAGWVGVNRSK